MAPSCSAPADTPVHCDACSERRDFARTARLLGCVLLFCGDRDARLGDYEDEETVCLCAKPEPQPSPRRRRWKSIALTLAVVAGVALVAMALLSSYGDLLRLSQDALVQKARKSPLRRTRQSNASIAFTPGASQSFPPLEHRHDAETERVMDIYCRGPILHAVQMASIFADSKHFVDMPIKANSSAFDIIVDFERRRLATIDVRGNATLERQLRRFLDDHFDPPGTDLRPITPLDYQELDVPPMIAAILDDELREWAFALHQLWRSLGRVPDTHVHGSYLHAKPLADPALKRPHTMLIVPGGRFRESYYWDSFWIVQGLLVSNMKRTARGVVNNLLEYVAEFGFVPNGGRIYYLTRSQPPMLSDMVRLVAEVTSANGTVEALDTTYLNATLPILEKEYAFWMQLGPSGHAVEFVRASRDGNGHNVTHLLNRYTSSANHPRPEAYREDVDVATEIYGDTTHVDAGATHSSQSKKHAYYNDIIAAAESGWDFSSRWFSDHTDIKAIATSSVIPVDLNAIMFRMEKNLEAFHQSLDHPRRAQFFRNAAQQRLLAMNEILWSDEHGTWKDFNLETFAHSPVVAVSDYTPLWAKAFDPSDAVRLEKVVASLQNSGLLQLGGIQATSKYTGQQWDAPNAWPPEQDIVIEGLLAVNTREAHDMARGLLRGWVATSLTGWKQTHLMFEKYNATEAGGVGVGGEYFPQFGFGWTNGVILKFLTIHQHLLHD